VPFSMPITGQVCFSLTRVLAPRSRVKEVLDAYVGAVSHVKVGDPFEDTTQMGPLSMQRQLQRVQGYIAKGLEEGAKLVIGGGRPKHLTRGFFVEPTVFSDVDTRMTIAQEEIFGPVVSFIAYDGIDRQWPNRRSEDALRRVQAIGPGPRRGYRGSRPVLRDQDDLLWIAWPWQPATACLRQRAGRYAYNHHTAGVRAALMAPARASTRGAVSRRPSASKPAPNASPNMIHTGAASPTRSEA